MGAVNAAQGFGLVEGFTVQAIAALLGRSGGEFSLSPVDLADCEPAEVLVELTATGICHTDLAVRAGDAPIQLFPAVLGHEGAGKVIAVGTAVTKVAVGDHVVLTFSSCGTCSPCAAGRRARCANFISANMAGSRPDGTFIHSFNGRPVYGSFFGQSSFATHAIVPNANVVKVRPDVPLELLGPLGCGVQTGAGTVLNHIRPKRDASLAIFGAGGVGLSAVMAAAVAKCRTIIIIDLNPARLALAEELGATHSIDAREGDVASQICGMVPGGVDHVIEATGAASAVTAAITSIRYGGTIALLGMPRSGAHVTIPLAALMAGELHTVVEGDSIPDTFIPELIELYLGGQFPFDRLISFYEFSEINQAVRDMEAGRVIKPVLRIARSKAS